jgi:hypothetical protein
MKKEYANKMVDTTDEIVKEPKKKLRNFYFVKEKMIVRAESYEAAVEIINKEKKQ